MVDYNFSKHRLVSSKTYNVNRNVNNQTTRLFNRNQRLWWLFNRTRISSANRVPNRRPTVPQYTPKIHVCFSNNRNKLAFLMGLNYESDKRLTLRGCINDTKTIKNVLVNKFGYTDNDIILMTDHTDVKPTRTNIIRELNAILERVRKENITELFLSFSGHGTFVKDTNGDEADGKDEALVPLDVYTNGIITDDYLHAAFLSKLPANVNVFSLMDCCHSGTILDLQFKYVHRGGSATNGVFVRDQRKTIRAKAVKISGSRDDQYSMDAFIDGEFKGAMTDSFEKTIDRSVDCRDLFINMSNHLKSKRFTQVPVLTSSFNYTSRDRILLK